MLSAAVTLNLSAPGNKNKDNVTKIISRGRVQPQSTITRHVFDGIVSCIFLIFLFLQTEMSNIAVWDKLQTNVIWLKKEELYFQSSEIFKWVFLLCSKCHCLKYTEKAFELVLREVCVLFFLIFVCLCTCYYIYFKPAKVDTFFTCWLTAWTLCHFCCSGSKVTIMFCVYSVGAHGSHC